MSLNEILSKLNSQFMDAQKMDYAELEEGEYTMSLDKSEFKLSKEHQLPMCSLAFSIVKDNHKGKFNNRKFFHIIMLATTNPEWLETTLGRAKSEFESLGIKEYSSIEDIMSQMPLLNGNMYTVTLKKLRSGKLTPIFKEYKDTESPLN